MEWFLLATSVCDGPLNPFLSTRGMSSAVVGLCHVLDVVCVGVQMIDDQDLGFIVNFLGVSIFALVIAYHYVASDPKYEAT
ncbi:hypothetical protein YC2023_068074 [Brassica napus]